MVAASKRATELAKLKSSLPTFCARHHDLFNRYGYAPFFVITIRFFPHSCLKTGFVARVTQREPHMKQQLITLPEHLSSPPIFVGFVLLNL